MIFTASDVSSVSHSLHCWEWAEYISEGFVILACAGELVADLGETWLGEKRKKHLERRSTILLVAALSVSLICLVRTNELSGNVIGSLGNKAEEADRKAKKAIEDSTTALTKSGQALDKSSAANDAAGTAQKKVGAVAKQLTEAQKETAQFLEDFREQSRVAFKRTGRRSVDTLAFLNALKGKKTGSVELWIYLENDESHQFGSDLWQVLKRAPGWKVSIPHRLPPPEQPYFGPSLHLVCHKLEFKPPYWKSRTAFGALVYAIASGTDAMGPFMDQDDKLAQDHFVIEVRQLTDLELQQRTKGQ